MEKSHQLPGEHVGQHREGQGHGDCQLGSSLAVLHRLVHLTLAVGLGHADLAAHLGHGHRAVEQPGVHTRRAHGRHRVAPHHADPRHVRQAVRRLHHGGRHDRHRQLGQRSQNISMKQIDVPFHPITSCFSDLSHI